MSRPRKKEEKMLQLQPRITEYFNQRKRKRSLDDLKDNEKSIKNPRKVVALTKNVNPRKENNATLNASNLLISVLKKETKSKYTNVKVIKDSSTFNTQRTISTTVEKIDSPTKKEVKEKPLIKEKLILEKKPNETSSDDVKTTKIDSQQTKNIKISKLETNIQTLIPKRLQKEDEIGDMLKTNLPLPENYKFLLKVFSCIDEVSMMLYKRGVIITFKKLQPALKNMSKKTVTLDDLGKIHSLLPEAFSFKRKRLQFSDPNKVVYEIVLEPSFNSESNIHEESKEILSVRKKKFYTALLERVKREHEIFLKETSKSRSVIRKVKINCWHPNFDFEKCQEIEVSDLAVFKTTKIVSPKQVLEKVMKCLKTDSNSQMPIEEASKNVSKQDEENQDYYVKLPATAKMIRNIFLSERKNVLTLSTLVEKIKFSITKELLIPELEKHVRLLCKIVPNWISLFKIGICDRVKLNKEIPFEKVGKILENLTKNK